MKRSRPSPPSDAPQGTVTLGGPLGWFSASLNVTSDSLLPEEITRIFGIEPIESQTKGIPLLREDGSVKRVPRFGRWSIKIKPSQTDEWDINEVIAELLTCLPESQEIWRQVAQLGKIQISLGLSLEGSNQEFVLEPDLLRFLGERQISIYFDIYRDDDFPEP